MSKSKDKIRISFIGNNAINVAGSMTLITWGKPQKSILVEAGLIQGEKSLLQEYHLIIKYQFDAGVLFFFTIFLRRKIIVT